MNVKYFAMALLLGGGMTLAACGDDDDPAGGSDTGADAADTGTGDSGGGGDTGGEDTGGEDTGGEDTGGEDTGGEDTGGEDTGGEDAGADVTEDIVEDTADVGIDAEDAGDVGADIGGDIGDVGDVGADVDFDVELDVFIPSCDPMSELRATEDGETTGTYCGTVTYVADIGWAFQEGPEGPGIFVFEGFDWENPDALAPGDDVEVEVNEVSSFRGTKQVAGYDALTITPEAVDVEDLIQDLSDGTLPSEDLEGELVLVSDATVTEVEDDGDVVISYGTAEGVIFRPDDVTDFCVGATFDVLAIVNEWEFDEIHRIQSYNVEMDVTSFDDGACPVPAPSPEVGDLVINEFLADPPADAPGDANCDGTRDGSDDEFVEIVNTTDEILSLTGVSITDDNDGTPRDRYTFGPGVEIPANGVVVVFGGGDPACEGFDDIGVYTSGGIGLNNGGDIVGLYLDGTELDSHTYGAEGGADESLTRSPDVTGDFTGHTTAAEGVAFSPGTRADGSAF